MMNRDELREYLLQEYEPDEMILFSLWSENDIYEVAESEFPNEDALTRDEAIDVGGIVEDLFDPDVGINFRTVAHAVREVVNDRDTAEEVREAPIPPQRDAADIDFSFVQCHVRDDLRWEDS